MPYYPPLALPQFQTMPLYGASRFWTWPNTEAAVSTGVIPLGRIYLTPFSVVKPPTAPITSVSLEVTAGASGASWRFGIYRANSSLEPGTVLMDLGAVSAATTGSRATWSMSAAQSSSLILGDYFLAVYALGSAQSSSRSVTAHSGSIMLFSAPTTTLYGAIRTGVLDATVTNPLPAVAVLSAAPSPRFEFAT